MFEKKGILIFNDTSLEDEITEIAIEAGAEDVYTEDESLNILCSPNELHSIKKIFEDKKLNPNITDFIMKPTMKIPVYNEEIAEKVNGLLQALDERDDIQDVFSNADFQIQKSSN